MFIQETGAVATEGSEEMFGTAHKEYKNERAAIIAAQGASCASRERAKTPGEKEALGENRKKNPVTKVRGGVGAAPVQPIG